MHMLIFSKYKAFMSSRSSEGGFVLPVVLVMLVLMTIVVLFMTRRSAIDERLAFNVRGVVTLETAAQYALRWCELALWVAPPGVATTTGFGADKKQPVPFMDAPAAPATSAWHVDGNWTVGTGLPALGLPADVLAVSSRNVSDARCLIEDARTELEMSTFSDGSEGLALADTRRKFRLTSRVAGADGPDGVAVVAHAQSEVRMNLN